MDDPTETLREAFEGAGYDVVEATINRDEVRVVLSDIEASSNANELRDITYETVDGDDVSNFTVSGQFDDNQNMITAIEFRYSG